MFLPQVSLVFFWGITVERSRSKIYSFKQPLRVRSRDARRTRRLSKRKMRWMLLVVILSIFALMLSGCAAPTKIVCEESKPLPDEMSRPLLPDARSYSSDVRTFLQEVEAWLKSSQESTTQQ